MMATDISSLAPGYNGRVVWLGSGLRDYEKHVETHFFLGTLTFSFVDCVAIIQLNSTTRLSDPSCPLPLALSTPLTGSIHRQSLGHHN
jgi:hypothetical protein